MKDIKFSKESKFLGRNGQFKSIGIVVGETLENHVSIQPITSKGQIGKAIICIPKDSVNDLIKALSRIDGVGGNILIPVSDKESDKELNDELDDEFDRLLEEEALNKIMDKCRDENLD